MKSAIEVKWSLIPVFLQWPWTSRVTTRRSSRWRAPGVRTQAAPPSPTPRSSSAGNRSARDEPSCSLCSHKRVTWAEFPSFRRQTIDSCEGLLSALATLNITVRIQSYSGEGEIWSQPLSVFLYSIGEWLGDSWHLRFSPLTPVPLPPQSNPPLLSWFWADPLTAPSRSPGEAAAAAAVGFATEPATLGPGLRSAWLLSPLWKLRVWPGLSHFLFLPPGSRFHRRTTRSDAGLHHHGPAALSGLLSCCGLQEGRGVERLELRPHSQDPGQRYQFSLSQHPQLVSLTLCSCLHQRRPNLQKFVTEWRRQTSKQRNIFTSCGR